MKRSRQLHLHVVGGLDWEPTKQSHSRLCQSIALKHPGNNINKGKHISPVPERNTNSTHAHRQVWSSLCVSVQSCKLGKSLTNIIPLGLLDYISSALTLHQTCSTTSVSPSPSVLLFPSKLSAAIQNNSLYTQPLWYETKCPQYEDAVVSSCCFCSITFPSMVYHWLQQHIIMQSEVTSNATNTIPGLLLPFRYLLSILVFSIHWEDEVCGRRCDCFGDGAAAGFMADVCVCWSGSGGERFTAYWCGQFSLWSERVNMERWPCLAVCLSVCVSVNVCVREIERGWFTAPDYLSLLNLKLFVETFECWSLIHHSLSSHTNKPFSIDFSWGSDITSTPACILM